MHLVSKFSLTLAVCAVGPASGFLAVPSFASGKCDGCERLTPPFQASKHDGSEPIKEVMKTFAVLSLGSILAFNVADASASMYVYDGPSTTPIFSSSTQLSVEVKTMDMSLPSYGDISDAKNTKASLSTLVIEQPSAMNVKSKAAPKKKEASKGPSMSTFLPSLDKQGPKASAEASAQAAERRKAQKETLEKAEKRFGGVLQIVEMDMPTYSGTTVSK